jgi:probable F420-dependent oxidoreductase
VRPFRFSATLSPLEPARRAWADAVRRVEDAGFTGVTVMDHFRSGGIWGPMVAAHAVAPSLRVGTLVLNNDLVHPALVAREAIAVDALTDGSLELGVGAGWDLADYGTMARERASAGVRIERLAESVAIMRQAFAGELVRFHGRQYTVEAATPWPRPCQERVPILIGGGGRRLLTLAARTADIVSIHRNLEAGVPASWAREAAGHGIAERVQWVREAAGERFASLELHATILRAVVTDDRETVASRLAGPMGVPGELLLASPHFLIGTVEQMAADLEDRRARWGISYWSVSESNAPGGNDPAALAPVIRRLAAR